MKEKFLGYITKKNLFKLHDRVLAAVSGGIDSVVLCHLLSKSGINYAIMHCNFNLRGEESDADELFVRKLAKKYKVPIYVQQFQTQAYADQEKISIQMAARNLRYAWFEELRQKEQYDVIATAHHQNDSLETVLLNITKGTGITGMHGINPKIGNIVRPLLFAEKNDVYEYVAEMQLAWREDSSNESIKYQRNLIRNEVVPLLKQINPNLENTIGQTIEKVSAVERFFKESVESLKSKALSLNDGILFLDILELQQQNEKQMILAEILKEFNFSFTDAVNIWESLESGKKFMSSTHILTVDRTGFFIETKDLKEFSATDIKEEESEIELGDIILRLGRKHIKDVKITSDANVALLDYDKVKFPLQVRRWKAGDWFFPLGMNKKKKISDFLIDKKVPVPVKDKTMVLSSADSVAWIVGHRIDNRFKIGEDTKEVLVIDLVKK